MSKWKSRTALYNSADRYNNKISEMKIDKLNQTNERKSKKFGILKI